MPNKIDIWSQASVLLGNGVQTSEAANNTFCNNARVVYETILQERLSSHRWVFNRAKAPLSRLPAAPLNEWSYQFQIPSEALTIYAIYPRSSFTIQGDKILANNTSLSVDYMFRPDEGDLPSYFVLALVRQLASELAYAVTDDAKLAQLAEVKARDAWVSAWTVDAQQRPTEAIESNPVIWARYA